MEVLAKPHFDMPEKPESGLYSVEVKIPIMVEYMNQIALESTSDPSVVVTLDFTTDQWDDLFDAVKKVREEYPEFPEYTEAK